MWGAWVAQLVGCQTSAQVMILQSMSSSPTSGSVPTAQSLEPASDSVSISLCPPPLSLCVCVCVCLKNKIHTHTILGCLGGSVGKVSNFGSGHDLMVREFQPCVGLCADSSEPGACFGFCVFLFLCPSPAHALSLKMNKM